MDGYFSKIMCSTSFFTICGLFISIDITHKQGICDFASTHMGRNSKFSGDTTVGSLEGKSHLDTKYFVLFDPYTIDNRYNTECIIQLEEMILKMYGTHIINKTPTYSLRTQVHTGEFKIHREGSSPIYNPQTQSNGYVLKISGVWESCLNYGITYKFTPSR